MNAQAVFDDMNASTLFDAPSRTEAAAQLCRLWLGTGSVAPLAALVASEPSALRVVHAHYRKILRATGEAECAIHLQRYAELTKLAAVPSDLSRSQEWCSLVDARFGSKLQQQQRD